VAGKTMTQYPLDFQPEIWNRLTSIFQKDRIGSAYLFSGPEGSGKEAVALAFATMMNCDDAKDIPCGSCPSCIRFLSLQDEKLTLIFPLPGSEKKETKNSDPLKGLSKDEAEYLEKGIEKKAKDAFYRILIPRARQILINQVRELRRTIFLKSTSKGRKCVLIFQAHTLAKGNAASANAILKILEEPPPNTTIILVTDYQSQLLPTIVSRCQKIAFSPLKDGTIKSMLTAKGIEENKAHICVQLSDGNIHQAKYLSKQPLEDLLLQIKDFIAAMTHDDSGKWKSLTQDLSQLARFKPEEYRLRIAMIQKWFHEAYLYRSSVKSQNILSNFSKDIYQFNQSFPNADLKGIHISLDKIVQAPDRNFYMPLVITTMLLDVRKYLAG
jgi:DNA polymerase-3 subunit delta'